MSHMQQEIRIRAEHHISDFIPNLAKHDIVAFAVIRPPSSGQVILSMHQLVTIEISDWDLECIPHFFEKHSVFYDIFGELLGEIRWQAEDYLVNHLDEILDFQLLPIESLVALRAEYDDKDYFYNWPGADDDDPDIQHIYAIMDTLDAIIDSRDGSDIRAQIRQTARGNGRSGFVYLLKSVSGHWKIGRAVNPNDRLKTFTVHLPFEVTYEHLIPTSHMAEAEAALHAQYAHKRVNGEWFALDEVDVARIKSIKSLDL